MGIRTLDNSCVHYSCNLDISSIFSLARCKQLCTQVADTMMYDFGFAVQ
jgi:hypothetical protein